jgi:nitrate/nitrite transporter NarK
VSVTVLLFVAFGLVSVGWNGLFLAEIAHSSPRGMVSVATSAAMVWNFGGILIGPALFATTYALIGSYALTFGWMAAIALAGVVLVTLSRAAARPQP